MDNLHFYDERDEEPEVIFNEGITKYTNKIK
jgi:hypothetical protein